MLTKLLIDKTKSGPKTIRLSDGRGMYLEIVPAGGKWWRFKYRFAGRERRMSLGVYPDVPLAAAREKREEARRQIAADSKGTRFQILSRVTRMQSVAEWS